MPKKFKLFAIIMAVFVVACVMAGCGDNPTGDVNSIVSQSSETGSTSELSSEPALSSLESVSSAVENAADAVIGAWLYDSGSAQSILNLYEDGTVLFSASDLGNRTFGKWATSGNRVTITLYGGDDFFIFKDDQLISENDPFVIYKRYIEENQ